MKKALAILTLVSLVSVAGQAYATQADAEREMLALAVISMAAGYRVEDSASAHYLKLGQMGVVKTTLRAGRSYDVIVGGCNDAYDVDIAVLDENRNVIGVDSDNNKRAVVHVTPKWTGDFYIVIQMARGTSDGAHFCQLLAYK